MSILIIKFYIQTNIVYTIYIYAIQAFWFVGLTFGILDYTLGNLYYYNNDLSSNIYILMTQLFRIYYLIKIQLGVIYNLVDKTTFVLLFHYIVDFK